MRARFVLSEMAIGLRRNLTMTLAVVITVAISLALVGAGLLIRHQVQDMKDYYFYKVEISVFLTKNVTADQRESISRDLYALPQVQQVFYESQQQAYERFQKQFKDSPGLVENVRPDALPESYRVKLKDPTKYAVVSSQFAGRPGVEDVVDQRRFLDKLFRILNGFRNAAYVIAGIQLIAATVLISNTIRVAAFSRRRETGIMRLVGASNLYIQLPFLLEGALAGLIGAGLACGFLALAKVMFVDRTLRGIFSAGVIPSIGWHAIVQTMPLLLLGGVTLSALASFVTLRRFLRV
jgi:cell division transport system permease protein